MNVNTPVLPDLEGLLASGASRVDPVSWHYIETLAQRTREQSGPAQLKLLIKLQAACQRLEARVNAQTQPQAAQTVMPSPMASLLRDMGVQGETSARRPAAGWPPSSPRVEHFKKQLSQISVQKQVSKAMAQAPHNAGPINSHMLVLRSLGLMREISPDYLNRFMAYVDTLLFLDSPEVGKTKPKKTSSANKPEQTLRSEELKP
ncbi:DUF2894 domain-containing protein [Limnohabitans sp. DCL3]|uniref:DUF2894 domain-containing protein n=1 Tax=Limnohabitans sp. DCL3 TaxID=3374103 RepID=UPI003A88C1CD